MDPATSHDTPSPDPDVSSTTLAEYELAADGYVLPMLELIENDLDEALETRDTAWAHTLVDLVITVRERYL